MGDFEPRMDKWGEHEISGLAADFKDAIVNKGRVRWPSSAPAPTRITTSPMTISRSEPPWSNRASGTGSSITNSAKNGKAATLSGKTRFPLRSCSKRSGVLCKNTAVRGWQVCQMHGARGGHEAGATHPQWKHGSHSRDAVELRRSVMVLSRIGQVGD